MTETPISQQNIADKIKFFDATKPNKETRAFLLVNEAYFGVVQSDVDRGQWGSKLRLLLDKNPLFSQVAINESPPQQKLETLIKMFFR